MESPVRICFGAVLVVNLLLLCIAPVNNALPLETSTSAVNETRYQRSNSTWNARHRTKTPDIALNELNPKTIASEENTEKYVKYKNRGTVKYNSQLKSSSESPFRRIRSTTAAPKLITDVKIDTTKNSLEVQNDQKPVATEITNISIVTTADTTKSGKLIDSVSVMKKSITSSSGSSTSAPIKLESSSQEEYEEEDEDEEDESFEKYSKNTFSDNFFSIPTINFSTDSENEGTEFKYKGYNIPSFSSSPNFFSDDNFHTNEYKFDFGELTTPKNVFFDQRFERISSSIRKNLETIAKTSPQPNITTHTITEEKLSNGTPSNKSTLLIKNTKEIRLLDNDNAGTVNTALSDVHGTSIYYAMSVLSTETYAINQSNDEDCDEPASETTVSTPVEKEMNSEKNTQVLSLSEFKDEKLTDNILKSESNYAPTLYPFTSPTPEIFNPVSPLAAVSTQNSISSTEKANVVMSSVSPRNRNYSRRLNFTSSRDSFNSVPFTSERPSYQPVTRKFYSTTPKPKRVWMTPVRNITKIYARPTHPTTIYSEHFNIMDKFRSIPPKYNRTLLTTVSSDNLNPVLQTEISGVKKIVHSQSAFDNSIPTLWKRGSTKLSSSTTASSTETESNVSEMEIPPTLNAWALASLLSPPSSANTASNRMTSTQKSINENELQRVGDILDKKEVPLEYSTTPMTTTTEYLTKNITDIIESKIMLSPSSITLLSNLGASEEASIAPIIEAPSKNTSTIIVTMTSTTSEKPIFVELNELVDKTKDSSFWLSASQEKSSENLTDSTEHVKNLKEIVETESIPPVDATKSTGFESITKFPSSVTTPQDDIISNSDNNTLLSTRTFTAAEEVILNSEKNMILPASVIMTSSKSAEDPIYNIDSNSTTASNDISSTTESDVTTMRFSFIPTESVTASSTRRTTTSKWQTFMTPTRTRKPFTRVPITGRAPTSRVIIRTNITTTEIPITTYRPAYTTTVLEDLTTVIPETTPQLEISSQILENFTQIIPETTTEMEEIDTTIKTTLEPIVVVTANQLTVNTTNTSITPMSIETSTSVETTSEQIEETTRVIFEIVTEINKKTNKPKRPLAESTTDIQLTSPSETRESSSEENSGSNEVITLTSKPTVLTTIATVTTQSIEEIKETTTEQKENYETTVEDTTVEVTTYVKSVTDEEITSYLGDHTTESSTYVGAQESGSGAAVAIAVSTIGVIALILLIGLLMVVRRRGRRGVYAQRCTPVSLDAYSLDSVSVGHRKGNQRLRASKRSYGNPAYDDEVTSHPMQYAALASFALDVESMITEWSEIPSVTVRPDEVPPGCEDKNRYSNVLPLPETRVPLSRVGNDPTTEYINANFITGPGNIRNYYIACQAPLPNTVAEFWRMIWEHNSRVIVMLTEYMENGVEKCYEYLPPSEISDNKRTFGDFQIVLKKREQRDKYAISSVQLFNLNTRTWRELTHLWFFWPAKGVPDDYDAVIDFLSEMRSYMKVMQAAKEYDEEGVEIIYGDQSRSSYHNLSKFREDGAGNGANVYSPAKAEEHMRRSNGTLGRMKNATEVEAVRPCTVVCASGAGRAGALVALDVCARALAAGRVDVPRVVRELRAQRPHAIPNKHHYIFLYKVLSEYGNKLMGGVDNL